MKNKRIILVEFMKDLIKICIFVLAIAGLIVFVIHENIKSIELDKKISKISKEIIDINEENRMLSFQLEKIKNSEEIKSVIKRDLNMDKSIHKNYIYLDNSNLNKKNNSE